jgi:glycosyltransferase involved in cell wall biosynthesis
MRASSNFPKVGIVIPAFNAGHFVATAVQSVLSQTLVDFEVVVVDDGSTDNTSEVVRAFSDPRLRYVRQENQGPGAARNAGAALVHGQYLAFLDSDDVFLPHKLAVQSEALERRPEIGLLAGGCEYIDDNGARLGRDQPWRTSSALDLESILLGGLTQPGAVLLRRSWFDQVGGFDPDPRLIRVEDMDLWYRLGLAGCRMAWLPSIVCQYRIHTRNMSWKINEHYRARDLALEKVFARADLPFRLRTLRGRVYARVRLLEAGRLYATGDTNGGRSRMQEAVVLQPELCDNGGRGLAEAIVSWNRDIWARQAGLNRVLDNLPDLPVQPQLLRRRVRAAADKVALYHAFEIGELQQVRKLWPRVMWHEPSWVLNRGTWSILLRSCGVLSRRHHAAMTDSSPRLGSHRDALEAQ